MRYEKLGNFVKLRQGLAVNKGNAYLFNDKKNDDFCYPLLRIVDLEKNNHCEYSRYVSKEVSKSVIIKDEDIVFSRVTGGCFSGFSGVVHNNLFVVDLLDRQLSSNYLYVVLNSNLVKQQVLRLTSSSVVPDLTHDMFKSIVIPVFEQQICNKISDLYFTLTEKIELNNKIISELESMAKTLYDYWFLQFDFPNEDGKPYKSSGGKMVYNEEFEREIPEGWEVKELGKLFPITMGSSPKGECLNENGEGIEFYQGSTDFGSLFPTERIYTLGPIRLADKNDILLSVRAPVGDMNIAMNRCCIGRGLAAVHCDSSLFALNTLKTLDKYFKVFNTSGTTFGALTSDGLKGQLVIAAPQKLVDKYKEIVDSAEKQIRKSEKENRDLVSLRDFLLPMLMNGQVTFKDAAEAHND